MEGRKLLPSKRPVIIELMYCQHCTSLSCQGKRYVGHKINSYVQPIDRFIPRREF